MGEFHNTHNRGKGENRNSLGESDTADLETVVTLRNTITHKYSAQEDYYPLAVI